MCMHVSSHWCAYMSVCEHSKHKREMHLDLYLQLLLHQREIPVDIACMISEKDFFFLSFFSIISYFFLSFSLSSFIFFSGWLVRCLSLLRFFNFFHFSIKEFWFYSNAEAMRKSCYLDSKIILMIVMAVIMIMIIMVFWEIMILVITIVMITVMMIKWW